MLKVHRVCRIHREHRIPVFKQRKWWLQHSIRVNSDRTLKICTGNKIWINIYHGIQRGEIQTSAPLNQDSTLRLKYLNKVKIDSSPWRECKRSGKMICNTVLPMLQPAFCTVCADRMKQGTPIEYPVAAAICPHTAAETVLFFFLNCFWWNRSPYCLFSPLPPLRGLPIAKCHPRWQPI